MDNRRLGCHQQPTGFPLRQESYEAALRIQQTATSYGPQAVRHVTTDRRDRSRRCPRPGGGHNLSDRPRDLSEVRDERPKSYLRAGP